VANRIISSGEDHTATFNFPDMELARQLFGDFDRHLKQMADALDIEINARGTHVTVRGDGIHADLAGNTLNQLYGLLKEGYPVYENDVDYAIRVLTRDHKAKLKDIFLDTVYVTSKKRSITPKSRAIVSRIILTRPAVEAGEALGFLPGGLTEKVDPYLRPLYDALHDMMRFEKVSSLLQRGIIEVAPIAFMRGRTLNDSFIILDEAQNTTSEQMKMFLTRIGFNSKAVITGDITQIDLPASKASGLVESKNILQDIEGIKFVFFSKTDVVRHRLVQDIIKAYEELEEEKQARDNRER